MERTWQEHERLIVNASAYMRLKLAENKEKPHWQTETEKALIQGALREWKEWWQALMKYRLHPTSEKLEALKREAADVHNYLEMILDKHVQVHAEKQNG